MSDERGAGQRQGDQDRSVRATSAPDTKPADPRRHAAQLLEQADRLMRLARELRREAGRLNASLDVPRRRPDGPDPKTRRSTRPESPAPEQPSPVRRRRFASAGERSDASDGGTDGDPERLEISDGTRLMVTNMITLGSSRDEILAMMRDELGLEDADAILAHLSP